MTLPLLKEMQVSEVLKVRMLLSIVLLPVLVFALSACNGATVVLSNVSGCSSLVSDELWAPVPGAPLVDPLNSTVADHIVFGNEQTNNLDDANADKGTIRTIITGCEVRDQEIQRGLNKRWYEFWE